MYLMYQLHEMQVAGKYIITFAHKRSLHLFPPWHCTPKPVHQYRAAINNSWHKIPIHQGGYSSHPAPTHKSPTYNDLPTPYLNPSTFSKQNPPLRLVQILSIPCTPPRPQPFIAHNATTARSQHIGAPVWCVVSGSTAPAAKPAGHGRPYSPGAARSRPRHPLHDAARPAPHHTPGRCLHPPNPAPSLCTPRLPLGDAPPRSACRPIAQPSARRLHVAHQQRILAWWCQGPVVGAPAGRVRHGVALMGNHIHLLEAAGDAHIPCHPLVPPPEQRVVFAAWIRHACGHLERHVHGGWQCASLPAFVVGPGIAQGWLLGTVLSDHRAPC